MKYRYRGKSDLKVSLIGLGCRELGKKDATLKDSDYLIKRALGIGLNFFDTADVYGRGKSEEVLGAVLEEVPRDSYILATKGGTEVLGPGRERQNCHPQFLRNALEGSLRRLRTDYVDLYQLHSPVESTT